MIFCHFALAMFTSNPTGKRKGRCVTGNTIVKRYAGSDEYGVPFTITVYSQVDVTIRERDSRDQVRVKVGEVVSVVKELIDGHRTCSDVWSSFPHHTFASAEEDG
ncbi:hypothetical protein ACJRO7_028072 [Eucalyptus globulus]|uniref:Anticodon-binding domain-containing protein n=1 Tax=Eucalyptus globulus TaxID=34317 RepID=A0ABD3JX46_EUCGL